MSAAENDREYRGAIPPNAEERARTRAYFEDKRVRESAREEADREALAGLIDKRLDGDCGYGVGEYLADAILAAGFGRLPVTEPTEARVTYEEADAALTLFREWKRHASAIDGMWAVLKADRERGPVESDQVTEAQVEAARRAYLEAVWSNPHGAMRIALVAAREAGQ